jgi:hypothetical protein
MDMHMCSYLDPMEPTGAIATSGDVLAAAGAGARQR